MATAHEQLDGGNEKIKHTAPLLLAHE